VRVSGHFHTYDNFSSLKYSRKRNALHAVLASFNSQDGRISSSGLAWGPQLCMHISTGAEGDWTHHKAVINKQYVTQKHDWIKS